MKDLEKQQEEIAAVINRGIFKEAIPQWKKHVPVYGWTKMNYPSTITGSLLNKYNKKPVNKENEEIQNEEKVEDENSTYKFMKNWKNNEIKNFHEVVNNYEKNKKGLIVEPDVPHNFNFIKEDNFKRFLCETGQKTSHVWLTTDPYEIKRSYVDLKDHYTKKYCTIFPKSTILGPIPDNTFSKKVKKIGDISFEEETNESEKIKNLKRLPPDNMTEEWLKINLNHNVTLLRLENHYWISKDVISKLTRMSPNIKELSLRHLDFKIDILENILKFGKNIESLDISYCNNLSSNICEILRDTCLKLKSLKAVGLSNCIDNDNFHYLGEIEPLNHLDVSLCTFIGDTSLEKFSAFKKPNSLKTLNLASLLKTSSSGLNTLILTQALSLLTLNLSTQPQKTIDNDLTNSVSKCKNLVNLDLSGCLNLTGDGVSNLFNGGLEHLESLNLSGISLNDSHFISAISANKNLKVLRVSNSILLTSSAIDYIISTENNIQLLEINRTKIPESKIEEAVKKKHPNLRIIRSTNIFWDPRNLNLKVPLVAVYHKDPSTKNKKKAPPKKNDDKLPENQIKRLEEEMKPKFAYNMK